MIHDTQKSVEFGIFHREMGHFKCKFWVKGGRRSPTTVGVRKLEGLPFHVVSKCWQWVQDRDQEHNLETETKTIKNWSQTCLKHPKIRLTNETNFKTFAYCVVV